MKLDFLVVPTYSTKYINIQDISEYVETDPEIISPTLEVLVPGFDTTVSLGFYVSSPNIITSITLGLSTETENPLPDGIYVFRYSVYPANENFVEKTIMRVDLLQEKFDEAFMRLDMMQCDKALKQQENVELNTIYKLIQGSIASANNCAVDTANDLYRKADKLLSRFNSRCKCCN